MTTTTDEYPPLLRWIHWTTAVLFIVAMLIGFYCGLQEPGTSPRRELLEVHKSLGATLFMLAVLRLTVRAATRVPPEPSSFGPLTRLAARLNHWALYFILFIMPITGYMFFRRRIFAQIFLDVQLAAPRRQQSGGRACGRGIARPSRLSGLYYRGLAYRRDVLACAGEEGRDAVAHVAAALIFQEDAPAAEAVDAYGGSCRKDCAHGKDERVPVISFCQGEEYLYGLVKMLSGGTS